MSRVRTSEIATGGLNPPINTVLPAISGATPPLYTGVALTCSNGTWANTPTSYIYQWLRDGSFIAGATTNAYTTAAADIGHILACRVTATNADGSASATSTDTASVTGRPPVNSVAPTATINYMGWYPNGVVTASTGTWTNSPTGYTYQWKRNGADISGATASTYTLTVSDIGALIHCIVTATNGDGSASYPTPQNLVLWSPAAHIGFYAMKLWLDPSDDANVTEVGGTITQISDKSGNGYHIIQPNAALQPVRAVATNWLRKVIRFPGTTLGHYMYCNSASFAGTLSTAVQTFAMYTDSESAANGRIFTGGPTTASDTDPSGSFQINRSSSTDTIRYNTGGSNQTITTAGGQVPEVAMTRLDGTNKYVSRDGNTEASVASGYSLNATCYALNAGKNSGSAYAWNGTRLHLDFGEVIRYAEALPAGEIDKLVGYLTWRWSTNAVNNMPSGHPYKSSPP